MPIDYRSGSFIWWPDAEFAPSLGIESDRLEGCLAEIKRRGICGAFGTHPYFREINLDFLCRVNELLAVAFWDVRLTNVEGLYGVSQLRYLRLTGDRPALDFTRLATLTSLVWHFNESDHGTAALQSLETLRLWAYRSERQSFSGLVVPANVSEFVILRSNVRTFDGLCSLKKLRRLEIVRCRDLASLEGLSSACPTVEEVLIRESGRVKPDDAKSLATSLPSLRRLVVNGQVLHAP